MPIRLSSLRRSGSPSIQDAAATSQVLEQVLADLENSVEYKAWVLEVITPHVGGDVIELGAGRGTYSAELRDLGSSLVAIEPHGPSIEEVRRVLADRAGVSVVEGTIDDVEDRSADCVVLLNVLEHIDDDRAALTGIARVMRPAGRVIIWVPAFPLLLGRFDRLIGHHRRYRRDDLRLLVEEAGFDVGESRYVNLPGFFGWLVVVRLLGLVPTHNGLARHFDRFVVPAARWVERRLRPPIGQSVFVVGIRRSGPDC